jgi:hypothetical protein
LDAIFVDSHTSATELRAQRATDDAAVSAWTQSQHKAQAEASATTRDSQVTFETDSTRVIENTPITVDLDTDADNDKVETANISELVEDPGGFFR